MYKTAKTIKKYTTNRYGYDLVIPKGSTVTNSTACGDDDSYRFWTNFHAEVEQITGFKDSILKHDLTHYGLDIPAEYCEPYPV